MRKVALSGAMFGDDILTHIRVAGEIGYQGVELRGMGPLIDGIAEKSFLSQMKNALSRWNLDASCFSTWLGGYGLRETDADRKRELERSTNFFKLSRQLHCPYVRVNPSRLPAREADEYHWEMDAKWIAKAADRANEFSVSIVMELHHGTLCDTGEHALKLLQMIERENVGLVFDPYNLYQVPTDYGKETIQALGSRIFNVHVKDIVALRDDSHPYAFEFESFIAHAGRFIPVQPQKGPRPRRFFANRLINQGGIDWHHVIASLNAVGYDGYLTVEATSGKDPNMLEGKELASHCFAEINQLLEAKGP